MTADLCILSLLAHLFRSEWYWNSKKFSRHWENSLKIFNCVQITTERTSVWYITTIISMIFSCWLLLVHTQISLLALTLFARNLTKNQQFQTGFFSTLKCFLMFFESRLKGLKYFVSLVSFRWLAMKPDFAWKKN